MSKENFINNDDGFQRFCLISLHALNKHAPRKKKHARGNQTSFFNKELSKAIMTRTKLRNIFLQNRIEENRIRYTKQISFCVSLLRKIKKRYYENLNEKFVVDNQLFRKTVKPLQFDNVAGKNEIHLIENNELVKTDLETAEVLNNFFSNIVQNLDISRYSNGEPLVSNTNDATLRAILKYRNLPRFNNAIQLSTFPEILKHADIIPFYKKGKKDIKGNYRPVSILPDLSKIFEKCMLEQMPQFFENIFRNINVGFGRVLVPSNVFWQC